MKQSSAFPAPLALTVAAGMASSSGFLLYDFAHRGTLDLSSFEGIVAAALWIAWVCLPYVFFGCVGLLMVRAGSVPNSVVTAVGVLGVLAGAAMYTHGVFFRPGMLSGLIFISCPGILLAGYAALLGAVFLFKPARSI